MYVGTECPPDCLDREGFIKCKVLLPSSLYHSVLQYKINSRLMFPLCSVCTDTMNQGVSTHCEGESCLVGTCVVDEVCKAVEMG